MKTRKKIAKFAKVDCGGLIIAAITALLAILAWELSADLNFISPVFFPKMIKIFSEFFRLFQSGEIYSHLSISLRRLLIGYGIGVFSALSAAILATGWRKTMPTIKTSTAILFALPKVTLLPVFILWFGIDETPKIFVTILGAYFFSFIPTYDGISKIDHDLIDAAKLDMYYGIKLITRIGIPCAIKSVTSGLKSGAGAAIAALMAAEMLVSNSGLGFLILQSQQLLMTSQLFAVLLVIAIISATFYFTLDAIGKRLFSD